ncbi:DUF4391 domain-containing protein [Megamonas hypermegale]|uniref:DUF4391 domain-containing protein n=1 Tax=Megamonas hypermegale TaxID=158847 RepID=UPI0026F16B75|nr:DUF4391 domain-containing protein [Megamonas hypermegale]
MLDLEKSTEFNKRIPKQKFYENMDVTSELKKKFAEQIRIIYWKNKIASTTINLEKGRNIAEIEVFELKLNTMQFDENILLQIDKGIPYHILFLLEYEGKYQAWIGYKEIDDKKIRVSQYYHTQWLDEKSLPCKMEGLDMDSVYENFVRQIAGDELKSKEKTDLKEDIEKAQERKKIEKQIKSLQTKIRKEKQFNRKIELNNELKKLKKQLN